MSERIAVLGLGYVGCVSAACLAKLGHQVTGVDLDEFKVSAIRDKRSPFFEPGLGELVSEVVESGSLRATTDLAEALADADIAFVAVGTPSSKNGNQSSDQIERVAGAIAETEHRDGLIVAIRSTVFPGTCESLPAGEGVTVVSHPEFLREGSAIRDFMEPSLIVVGGADPARQRVANLYAELDCEPSLVELRTAEMIKYACNAFHALKISFANEIGALSEAQGIPADEVMATLCQDTSLNISPAYLRPGFAFGGSCLPKDLRALVYRGNRLDLDLPLINNVLPSNTAHLERAVEQTMAIGPKKLGFFGLTFKENTDDLRESPTIALLEHLIGKGREIRIYDPNFGLDSIYGANQRFLLEHIPHVGKLLNQTLEETLAWADHLVLTQKPKQASTEAIQTSGLPVLNLIGGRPFASS